MNSAILQEITQTFDLIDKNKVISAFSAAAHSYDEVAELQRRVGLALLEKIVVTHPDNQVFADIGCGTGDFTLGLLQNVLARHVIAIDIAQSMLLRSRKKLSTKKIIDYVCADAENLPLTQHSIDAVYSNLALQWCVNLTQVFEGFKQILKPAGQIAFTTFGPATLQELKASWSCVDNYSHVNSFYSTDQLFNFLQRAGFENILIETRSYKSYYPSVFDLMRELKSIGAHHVLAGRNRKTTSKGQMQAMISEYQHYRVNNLVPATYQVIYVQARVAS